MQLMLSQSHADPKSARGKLGLTQKIKKLLSSVGGLLQIMAAYSMAYWVMGRQVVWQRDVSAIQGLKPPFVVLGNHTSNLDPALVQIVIAPWHCQFLTSNFYFRLPILGRLLTIFGCIPKIQFASDLRSTRRALAALAQGGVVGIFPEGRRSIDGSTGPITDSVARFIKMAKVPVVTVKTQGGYLVWPRWSAFWRSGKLETEAKVLFTVQQIRELSVGQIYADVCQALAYDEYEWNRQAKVECDHPKAGEKLHQILHQCPRCLAEQSMVGKGARLVCTNCENTAQVDRNGSLQPLDSRCVVFSDPVQWFAWQDGQLAASLDQGDYSFQAVVADIQVADKFYGAYRSCGSGQVELTQEGLRFAGIIDGQSQELFFPIALLPSVSTEFALDFEICDEENAWWIFLAEEQQTIRLERAIAGLHQRSLVKSSGSQTAIG
jgi:1-acyl-sn-glycerol-3-phosphate acyltransferase